MLKYREDRRALAFIAATLLLMAGPFVLSPPWPLGVAWVFLNAMVAFACCVINHNHVHLRMGRTPLSNRVIGVLLTIAKGHTVSTVIIPHNLVHHRHRGGDEDWMPVSFGGRGWGIVRIVRYIWRSALHTARVRNAPGAPRLGPDMRRSLAIERSALTVAVCATLAIDPLTGVIFVYVPWLLGMAALLAVNFLQHDGCDIGSEFDHSRNFVGKKLNWLFFNNGFHTAHHLYPTAHWSRLPELHARTAGEIRRGDLQQRSLLRFVVCEYLLGSGPAGVRGA